MTSENTMEMDRLDQFWGRVRDRSRSGVYIVLSNGITVFSYQYAPPNSTVLCTVKGLADPTRGHYFPSVWIDSIQYEDCA